MRRLLLAGVVLAIAGTALAQTSVFSGLFGSEAVVISQGGPNGQSTFTTAGRIASGPAIAYFSTFPAAFTIGSVVGTVNTAGIATGGALGINAAASAVTITFPPTSQLLDGETINVCNFTATAWTASVTMAANTGQTLVGAAAIATEPASTCTGFTWVASASTWFRSSLG